jgi:5-methylcytosine-specific restriction endonuclease McrA
MESWKAPEALKFCPGCKDRKPRKAFCRGGHGVNCRKCVKSWKENALRKRLERCVVGSLRRKKAERYFAAKAAYSAVASVRRRTREERATPVWANLREIGRIHFQCQQITKTTGIPHHVDHIVPLKGKTVCGLNIPANLQIITAKQNLEKSNKLYEEQAA